jgi:hypothetical protein
MYLKCCNAAVLVISSLYRFSIEKDNFNAVEIIFNGHYGIYLHITRIYRMIANTNVYKLNTFWIKDKDSAFRCGTNPSGLFPS